MSRSTSVIRMTLPRGFDLPKAVCSYGYYLLAPNRWEPATQTLHRPLHAGGDKIVQSAITQRANRLDIHCNVELDRLDRKLLRRQVARMLRVPEDLAQWHKIHPVARRAGFGRLFRSPTLFEDVIKTITGCNVTWPNTMRMNALLCQEVGQGAFPTPHQLAQVRSDWLQRRCKVGYRAKRIVLFARQVAQGQWDLDWFENPRQPSQEIYDRFRQIYGIGDYAASNLCHLVGRYDRVAIDSETYRHFRQQHGITASNADKNIDARIRDHFEAFAPYQFLAYWFELWQGYQARFGDARGWTAQDQGPNFTAANLK